MKYLIFVLVVAVLVCGEALRAEEATQGVEQSAPQGITGLKAQGSPPEAQETTGSAEAAILPKPESVTQGEAEEGTIETLKFKDADIRIVLQAVAEKVSKEGKKLNIVTTPSVQGLVTVNLQNVDWQTALKVITTTYGYGYKWIGDNIILISTLDEIKERDTKERELQGIETPLVRVFKLRYLDASDAKKAVDPLLSPLGRSSVLELTGQAGWEFGTDVTKRARSKEGKVSRAKILLVSDVTKKLDDVENLLKQIDVSPKQILIKSRIMEVNRDLLRDIGFDWGSGTSGASDLNITQLPLASKNDAVTKNLGGHMFTLGNFTTPSVFGPKTTGLNINTAGLKMVFRQLVGTELEVILHALEEDTRTNTLSAPTILTLNNQEASILVGRKYPIVEMSVSTQTNQIIGGSLEEYRDIGIQLNVVPQICGEAEDFINMIIHPAVTTYAQTVKVTSQSGTTLVEYPIIETREAETQIVVRDGETIVLGGLLKDVKSKQEVGVPILSKIPIIGAIFRRNTRDTEKIDLLIFITAKIVKPGDILPQEITNGATVCSEFKKVIPKEK